MKANCVLISFLLVFVTSQAQEKMTKADKYFYGYSYELAINEYKKEMVNGLLQNEQLLNLADAYYKLGDFKNASKYYLDVNKKDTIITIHQFNKMLQSLAKTSNADRVKTFLNSKKNMLSNELLENADFNYELLGSNSEIGGDIFVLSENSPQADFAPSFYKEDRLLFSSGRIMEGKKMYEPSSEAYLDIYVTRIRPDGRVMNSNPFTNIPNTKFHKATPYYSEELEKLFYVLSNSENGVLSYNKEGKNSLAIGVSNTNAEFNFLLKDLSTSFYYPFYNSSNGRLYFAANLEDSYGGTDLYYVNTNNGQIMSQPNNLGPRINSPGNEISPYILNNSFYFSSDVFYGIGGMDIYKSNIDTDGTLGVPINLGVGVNSTADDFGFIIRNEPAGNMLGYFSSNRPGGKGKDDIYGVKYKETPGLRTLSLKGTVVNLRSKTSIEKASVMLLDDKGDLIKEVYTNDEGKFRVEIPWRDQISLEITKSRYSIFSSTLNQSKYEEIRQKPLVMGLSFLDDHLTEKEGKVVVKLQKFYFDKGRSDVTSLIKTELDKVVDAMLRFPKLNINIENHTNSKGYKTTNKKLSQKRADNIKSYLMNNGVKSARILLSEGFGEERLTNNCEDGVYCLDFLHKQNERTWIVIANSDEL